MALAAFASLGLPGLSGFVAEFQIFVGTFAMAPFAAAIALFGILITAGLLLWTIQRLFLGEPVPRWEGMRDMALHERLAIFPLLALVLAIGLMPFWILDVIDGFSIAIAEVASARP
jgi:NADH-quinone oxidoreductase subunit M